MNLIIDIGNSVAKLAIFDKDELVEVFRGSNHSLDSLPMLCSRYPLERGIIAMKKEYRLKEVKENTPQQLDTAKALFEEYFKTVYLN